MNFVGVNETGNVYGQWTVLCFSHKTGQNYWMCQCSCGKVQPVAGGPLRCGKSMKCKKCAGLHARKGVELRRSQPEYAVWQVMIQRCTSENNEKWPQYGGRGINVCKRWSESFDVFIEDMGHRPSNRHSIDRIDNDGDYCKENCRWATVDEQSRNKSNNTRITISGETLCLCDWLVRFVISLQAWRWRVKNGMSQIEALQKPLRKLRKRVKAAQE